MKKLHPPQVAHVDRLKAVLAAQNSAIDFSPCGTGKTLCAAEIARQTKDPLFVVAPLSTLPAWRAELADRGVKPLEVINYEKLRGGKTKWVTKQGSLWTWKVPSNCLIVFDEAQRLKSASSLTSKIAIAAKPFKTLLLSGSLAENPSHLRASGYLAGLHKLNNFILWAKARGCAFDFWGKLYFNDDQKILQQLHNEIMPAHGSRMTLEEMSQYMPKNKVLFEKVDFGDKGEIEKLYSEMDEELAVLMETAASDKKGAEALTVQLRARQKTELLKVPLLAERATDLAAEGNSVIVFLSFTASLAALSERLGGIPLITGQHGDRQQVIEDFQADKIPILGVNLAAGGVGISLHGKKPRTTLLSVSYNPVEVLQALGRAPRVGGGEVIQHVLTAAGTIEDKVSASLQQKLQNIDTINTGGPVDTQPKPDESNTPVKSEETEAHAQFNPSSLSLFERCPGFRSRESTSEAAERGTRIHSALEKDSIHSLNEKERPTAQLIKDYVDSIIADRRPAVPDYDYREIKMTMDLGDNLKTFGTCDRLFIYGSHGIMLDYKSGYRAVADAEVNAQGWAYVIGAFQKFPMLQTIKFYFLIPNRDEVSFHTFSRDDLPRMRLRLNTIIRRAMEADPKLFNPGPELCEYCSRQGSCPALAQKALSAAAQLADGLPLPESMIVDKDRPDDLPKILRLAPIFEEWAKTAKKEALRVNLEEGIEIPGFARYERSTPRGITSVIGAWDLVKEKGVSIEDFLLACGSVSVPELEDLVVANVKRGSKGKPGKGAARQEFENELRAADLLRDETKYFYLQEKKN